MHLAWNNSCSRNKCGSWRRRLDLMDWTPPDRLTPDSRDVRLALMRMMPLLSRQTEVIWGEHRKWITLENWTCWWKKPTPSKTQYSRVKRDRCSPFTHLHLSGLNLRNNFLAVAFNNLNQVQISLLWLIHPDLTSSTPFSRCEQNHFNFPLIEPQSFLLYTQQVELFYWRLGFKHVCLPTVCELRK